MDKQSLPPYIRPNERKSRLKGRFGSLAVLLTIFASFQFLISTTTFSTNSAHIPVHAEQVLDRCRALYIEPGPSPRFHSRSVSDRFVPGTKAILLRNARIWTGGENGTEVVTGDIYLNKGIIQGIGSFDNLEDAFPPVELEIIDVQGAWVTPGIVDNHSHLGDGPSPALDGAEDDNSLHGITQPWLRSLDGLNTHDDAYALSIAGGITTALVLPGSANAIGGQAFTIKLRPTLERSPTAMLLEPPADINGTYRDPSAPLHWRQMKHACGENPSRVYDGTRMDTFWAFRKAYDTARQLKEKQDAFCSKALAGDWAGLESQSFPDDLQWEALADVLRGRVKVQTHCYETVDLDDLIRLSNEFKFPIAAVHHAHEAYLVPDVLKKAYGKTPAVAMFATNARYKREAYRGSEFAPRILAENGIRVVMKSDHPVLDSRHLLYEAQQAYYYGLPENLALASITSTPAGVMGLDHRIGYVKEGWDADLVIWDSHPLALGATPAQVYIDGIAQLESPFVANKSSVFQATPKVPNFDREKELAIKYEGLPPLAPTKADVDIVLFTNVASVYAPVADEVQELYSDNAQVTGDGSTGGVVVVRNGALECYGSETACPLNEFVGDKVRKIDLKGGSIAPGLLSYGSPLGLEDIQGEPSTWDGAVYDPLSSKIPSIVGGDESVIRAVDGLQFSTRDAFLAYRAGVTKAITAPTHYGFFGGLGATFSTGASHKLEFGAVLQETTALHVTVAHLGSRPSISTQIAALRRMLLSAASSKTESEPVVNMKSPERTGVFAQVVKGKLPIVVEAYSADVIATLILLKSEVETKTGTKIQMTISGATEAHLLAKELGEAGVGVIFVGPRPFPTTWEQRRILPGPPLTQDSEISLLVKNNVTVGIGIEEQWSARNTRFDIGWAALEADGDISKAQALALASTNLEKLLGGRVETAVGAGGMSTMDLVVTEGGDLLSMESKVVGVLSPTRRAVDLF